VSAEQKSAPPELTPGARRRRRARGRALFDEARPALTDVVSVRRQVPPPPRLTQVIAAAYQTYNQAVDAAVRELLAEVVIAMGIDQDFRMEISVEDATQVLEALRYIREVRS
jgi:protein-disulfide isomerase-like protein with CxxC motif